MIEAFGKIHPFGHRDVRDIFHGPVVVEEKVDGSQFSMANINGELHCRSKGTTLDLNAPGMFAAAVQTAKALHDEGALPPGVVYRCEYLAKNRHNVLTYNRVPDRHLVLWGVDDGGEVQAEAARLGLSPVPVLFMGHSDPTHVQQFLNRESFLGGVKIEGIVVKRSGMVAKLVSAEFREMHTGKAARPQDKQEDLRVQIADSICNENRYAKVRQHLLEAGELAGGNTDIPKLLKELHKDVREECLDEIKNRLLEWALPVILKRASAGMAPWYMNRLQYESLLPKED